MTDDGTLAKHLFFGIVRQFRLLAGLSSVDAALTYRCFGISKEAVQVVLETIEEVKYFLRIAYGGSK